MDARSIPDGSLLEPEACLHPTRLDDDQGLPDRGSTLTFLGVEVTSFPTRYTRHYETMLIWDICA